MEDDKRAKITLDGVELNIFANSLDELQQIPAYEYQGNPPERAQTLLDGEITMTAQYGKRHIQIRRWRSIQRGGFVFQAWLGGRYE